MQLLTEQIEQQKHEIDLFNSQFKILKEQLKLETQIRLDAQVHISSHQQQTPFSHYDHWIFQFPWK